MVKFQSCLFFRICEPTDFSCFVLEDMWCAALGKECK
jgi:hypothetical protein